VSESLGRSTVTLIDVYIPAHKWKITVGPGRQPLHSMMRETARTNAKGAAMSSDTGRQIREYRIPSATEFTMEFHSPANVVHVAATKNGPRMWVEEDLARERVPANFSTGDAIPAGYAYVGTCIMDGQIEGGIGYIPLHLHREQPI